MRFFSHNILASNKSYLGPGYFLLLMKDYLLGPQAKRLVNGGGGVLKII